jgi:hypothetical protein
LFDLDGKAFDFWKQVQTRLTVVVFTRSDCPISNRFAPEIRRLYDKHQPQGVDFYLVYIDPRETPDRIRRHLTEFAYPCSALHDPRHALVQHCNATRTPEAALFNRDGKLVYVGRINDLYLDLGSPRAAPTTHDLDSAIESTVAGRPVAAPRTEAVGCPIADLKD